MDRRSKRHIDLWVQWTDVPPLSHVPWHRLSDDHFLSIPTIPLDKIPILSNMTESTNYNLRPWGHFTKSQNPAFLAIFFKRSILRFHDAHTDVGIITKIGLPIRNDREYCQNWVPNFPMWGKSDS